VAATRPTPKSDTSKSRPIKVTGKKSGEPDKSVPQVASELWTLTVDYAKQEIKDPVRGLGSYLLWGSVSMLLIGIGMVLLAIGGLRALQTETGSMFTGSLSWAPYGIVLVGALFVLGVVGFVMTRGKK
jgi:hypothetical protein